MIGVGEEFPHTALNGVVGINPDKVIKIVYTDDEHSDWKVIFFYPKDFTFIRPTEIVAYEKDAEQDDCSLYGISPDNPTLVDVSFPLLADSGNMLAEDLEIVSDENVPYRATYIVDPEGIIQHVSVNALDTGRNVDEIIRTLHALRAGGLTGCSWTAGDEFVA